MPDYSTIAQHAEKLWDENTINSPPLPIIDIAKNYGLEVEVVNLPDRDISGFIDFENKIIYVNSTDSSEHQRFTIAHELGHWILHKDKIESNPSITIVHRKPIRGKTEYIEKEANCFAANLLVPKKELFNDLPAKAGRLR